MPGYVKETELTNNLTKNPQTDNGEWRENSQVIMRLIMLINVEESDAPSWKWNHFCFTGVTPVIAFTTCMQNIEKHIIFNCYLCIYRTNDTVMLSKLV